MTLPAWGWLLFLVALGILAYVAGRLFRKGGWDGR